MESNNSPVALSNLASLGVTGKDATSFLHGQFCADLLSLPVDSGCLTAWCTAKGRVISTLFAFHQAEGWMLILPANLAARVTRRLRMFILRADVMLHLPAADAVLLGLDKEAAAALDPEQQHRLLRHPAVDTQGPRFFLPGAAAPQPSPFSARDWARLDAEAGLPWVDAGTSEKFLPQELDLERWAGLSYSKGCYPGQEIVARLRYRGTVKRGLFRLRTAKLLQPTLVSGQHLLNAAGEAVATVLYATDNSPDELLALAVVDFSAGTAPVLYSEPGGAQVEVLGPVES
jgi:hypothetical protein